MANATAARKSVLADKVKRKAPEIVLLPNKKVKSDSKEIWSHFQLIEENGQMANGYTTCTHCKCILTYRNPNDPTAKNYGTSTLKTHLDRCSSLPKNVQNLPRNQPRVSSFKMWFRFLIEALDSKYFTSCNKATHWIATFLDPTFREFDFMPEDAFKRRTLLVFVMECNLNSLKSVRQCATKIISSGEKIDVLINNAGMGGDGPPTKMKTEDGLNVMMQSNHLGHFLLTNLLLDFLKSNPNGCRVVNVASMFSNFAHDFDVNDLNYENQTKNDQILRLYSWSKLANILFARELAKKLEATNVTSNCLHPGAIVTEIGKARPDIGMDAAVTGIMAMLWACCAPFVKNKTEGVQTHLYLALSPAVKHISGHYFSDCKPAAPPLNALDDKLAADLWRKSVELTQL